MFLKLVDTLGTQHIVHARDFLQAVPRQDRSLIGRDSLVVDIALTGSNVTVLATVWAKALLLLSLVEIVDDTKTRSWINPLAIVSMSRRPPQRPSWEIRLVNGEILHVGVVEAADLLDRLTAIGLRDVSAMPTEAVAA